MSANTYPIRLARSRDLAALPIIERAAARLLTGHAPASVLAETIDADALLAAQAAGRLWVALADNAPVGFALVELLAPDLPHLAEIDVHPEHGRRGVGAALVRAVCSWLATRSDGSITLTTFRDVPWNMPFYSRLGFEELPPTAWRPEIRGIVKHETARGLDPTRRVVMRYRATSG